MTLKLVGTSVSELSDGVWEFQMPPHQIRRINQPTSSVGAKSVMICKSPIFIKEIKELHCDIENINVLNIGTGQNVICIDALEENKLTKNWVKFDADFSPGDLLFLSMVKSEMSLSMQKTAIDLLSLIRERSPGELKRGKSRNFSDTPDNFWYVIVQPRIDQLSVTVRGDVDHFKPIARLPIKDDRGNTLFKITGNQDIKPALDIIFHAKRK
jgi:hypothetical protein